MRRVVTGVVVAAVAVIGFASTALATTSAWTESIYNSSDHALKGVALTNSSGGTASFDFAPNVFTATLTSNDESFTGDLTGKTLHDTLSVTGMSPTAMFVDQNNGGCVPDNKTVRFFFQSGGTGAGGQRGFFTTIWWSNPVSVQLVNVGGGVAQQTISASLSDPSMWSDWNGQSGSSSPEVTAAFDTAVSKVRSVGLSFGGGCFFENGVTTSDGSGTFNSSFSES